MVTSPHPRNINQNEQLWKTLSIFMVFFCRQKNNKRKKKDISSQSSALVYNEIDEFLLSCHKLYLCAVCDHSVNYWENDFSDYRSTCHSTSAWENFSEALTGSRGEGWVNDQEVSGERVYKYNLNGKPQIPWRLNENVCHLTKWVQYSSM